VQVLPGGHLEAAVHLRSQLVAGALPVREMEHCGVTPAACTPAHVVHGGHAPGWVGDGACEQGGAQMQPFWVSRPPYSSALHPVFGSPAR
jgi:hypothetical protein